MYKIILVYTIDYKYNYIYLLNTLTIGFVEECEVLMKRNRLILTVGILMLVGACLCLLLSVVNTLSLVELLQVMGSESVEPVEINMDNFLYATFVLAYVIIIALYLAETVVNIVFGIKLIVKFAKNIPLDQYKGMAITMQVFCYVFAGLAMGSDYLSAGLVFAFSLTSGILLSVALAQNKKEKENALLSSYGGFKDDAGKVDASSILGGKGIQKPFNEKSYAEELSDKIQSLQKLKSDNLITDEEYLRLVHRVLGLEEECGPQKGPKQKKTKKGKTDEG